MFLAAFRIDDNVKLNSKIKLPNESANVRYYPETIKNHLIKGEDLKESIHSKVASIIQNGVYEKYLSCCIAYTKRRSQLEKLFHCLI